MGNFDPQRTSFEKLNRRFIKISAEFCDRYKAENICNSGITKFIGVGPRGRVSNRFTRSLIHCESASYRNVVDLAAVASVVHS